MSHVETQRAQTGLVRACDVVYGITNLVTGTVATWYAIRGHIGFGIVVALWGMLIVNIAWSRLTVNHDRVRSDFLRGIVCIPFGLYMYAAESHGVLAHFWLPAFIQAVAVCLSLGIGTRRLRAPFAIAYTYTFMILARGGFTMESAYDALGIWLGTSVLSIVAVQLGRTLVDATEQRDEARAQRERSERSNVMLTERTSELVVAIEELHREMEHRIRLEAELAHAHKLESVGRLAAGVAHEINTPIQFVGNSLQFMREGIADLLAVAQQLPPAPREEVDLPYLTSELPQALDRAEDGLARVAKIVRSMNVFAHPDRDEMTPSDLNRAIEATVTMAQNELRPVADVRLELAPDLPFVACFVGELNQAVLNIVINAAHAIGEAGTRGTITVRTRAERESVLISIADTGPGIPANLRARIFEPFFTTKPVGKGTGQGLSIAHAVAAKHGGQLWFESEVGIGTTFFLRLPLAPALANAA